MGGSTDSERNNSFNWDSEDEPEIKNLSASSWPPPVAIPLRGGSGVREMATQSVPQTKKVKANWTSENKKIFLDLAVEQMHKRNRPRSGFNSKGYEAIISEFNKRTGLKYDRLQFKNCYNNMRDSWREWKKLIKNTGMGWDPYRRTITVDDACWEDYLKTNPKAKEFRKAPLQFEDEMDILFCGTIPTAEGARCSMEPNLPPRGCGTSQAPGIEDLDNANPDFSRPASGTEVEDDCVANELRGNQKKRRSDVLPSEQRPKKVNTRGEIREAISTLVELAKLKFVRYAPSQVEQPPQASYSFAAVVSILENMEGVVIGSKFYYAALDVFGSPDKRELFVVMNPGARLGWLRHLVGGDEAD